MRHCSASGIGSRGGSTRLARTCWATASGDSRHDWVNAGTDASFLYGGGRLELAEAWVADCGSNSARMSVGSWLRVAKGWIATVSLGRGGGASSSDCSLPRQRGNGMATLAFVQRRNADEQRLNAEQQQRNAEEQGRNAVAQASRADAAADDATRQAERADAAATLAEARRVRAEALVVPDYDRALLLAVEGRHLEDSREARSNLLATIQRSPAAAAVIRSETEEFLDLAFTPDGKTLLASGSEESPAWAPTTSRPSRGSLHRPPGRSVSSAVSPDGRLAVMSSGRTVWSCSSWTWRRSRSSARRCRRSKSALTRLSFSPDGRYVAAVPDNDLTGVGLAPAIAYVWDVAQGGEPMVQYPFSAPNGQRDVAFLPDSKQILAAGADGTAIVEIATGARVGQISGAHAPIAVSPDGRTLAAALDPNQGVTIGLFDLTSGQRSAPLAGHRERVARLAFSPDGTRLASGADDHLVMLWDVASGQRRAVYEGHAAGVNDVAFSPDGKKLWSGGDDRAIFVWDLQHADSLVHEVPKGVEEPALAFVAADMNISPDGRYVAFPWAENESHFQIRDVATGALSLPSATGARGFISFSPDGERYLTVDDAGTMRVWDRETGAVLADSTGNGQMFSNFPPGRRRCSHRTGARWWRSCSTVTTSKTLSCSTPRRSLRSEENRYRLCPQPVGSQ